MRIVFFALLFVLCAPAFASVNLVLKWSQPTDNFDTAACVNSAGANTCFYEVEYNGVNQPEQPRSSRTRVFEDVAGGTHEFRVRARNAFGTGPWSEKATFVGGVPSVPTGIELEAVVTQ